MIVSVKVCENVEQNFQDDKSEKLMNLRKTLPEILIKVEAPVLCIQMLSKSTTLLQGATQQHSSKLFVNECIETLFLFLFFFCF